MLNKYVLIETFFLAILICQKNVIYAGALGVIWFN